MKGLLRDELVVDVRLRWRSQSPPCLASLAHATMSAENCPEFILEREFIGYGMDPPNPTWPGGANIAVSFVINYYMGAELSVLYGDDRAETMHTEIPVKSPMIGRRVDMTESSYEYGAREGVRRLLELFDGKRAQCTWNVSTMALEAAPYWAKAIVQSGSEISCASKRYIDYFDVPAQVEGRHVAEAIDSLQKITGDATLPHGWMIDRMSNRSIRLYAREHAARNLPLLYSSDSSSDDLPYWVPSPLATEGKHDTGLLMVPFTVDTSDFRFIAKGSGWSSPVDFYDYLVDTFDYLYEEGRDGEPKMMTVILHPHIIGHAGRFLSLRRFVEYITSKEKVWIARRDEIAQHWTKTFPYDRKTAFGQTPAPPC